MIRLLHWYIFYDISEYAVKYRYIVWFDQFNQLHTFSVSFAVSMSYPLLTSCSKDLIHKKSNYLNACLCDNSSLLFIFFLSTLFYVIEIDAINNQKSSISCYLIYLNCYWVDVSNLTTLIRYANESKPYREIYKSKCVLFLFMYLLLHHWFIRQFPCNLFLLRSYVSPSLHLSRDTYILSIFLYI